MMNNNSSLTTLPLMYLSENRALKVLSAFSADMYAVAYPEQMTGPWFLFTLII